ncbi:MAG: putative helicase [Caulobacteraceae bacterium]|nr:putative helicase [Caulobacteraceae bacterium]
MAFDTLSESQITTAFGWGPEIDRGRAYFRQGRARLLSQKRDDQGVAIESEVDGSRPAPYRQRISLTVSRHGKLKIEGACDCPMSWNCKHVVAATLAWRATPADPYQLPRQVADWLGKLSEAVARSGETWPEGQNQRLIYLLDAEPDGQARVAPMSVKLDRKGEITGKPRMQDAGGVQSGNAAKFLRHSDLGILSRISSHRRWPVESGYNLVGAPGAAALMDMAATGRCRWRELDGRTVSPGPAVAAQAEWRGDERGRQRLVIASPERPGLMVLKLAPPHYFDPERCEVGRLAIGVPDTVATLLAEAPVLEPALTAEITQRLEQAFGGRGLKAPVPQPAAGYSVLQPPPQPHLKIGMAKVERARTLRLDRYYRQWTGYGTETIELPVVRLSFDYAGVRFAYGAPAKGAPAPQDPKVRILRDPAAEKRLTSELAKAELSPLHALSRLSPEPEQINWLTPDDEALPIDLAGFILDHVPLLEAQGWSIEIEPELVFSRIEADPGDWEFGLTASTAAEAGAGKGADWFDLDLGLKVGGERLNILPLLLDLLQRLPQEGEEDEGEEGDALDQLARTGAKTVQFVLDDGRILSLPLERVIPILRGLLEVWGPQPAREGPRLSRWDASALAELQGQCGPAVAWSGAGRLMELAAEFKAWGTQAPTATAPTFKAQLRPYQQTGFDWLQMLGRCGFGGLLADDMGLGKTVQTLAHLTALKAAGRWEGPALVVAPTSVLPNWATEAERFAPELKPLVLRGKDRAADFERIGECDLVLTSYPLLARDREVLTMPDWGVAILDEGQTIRNPATAAAQAAFALKAGQRLVLSGTPVENHLGDIWSLMNFLNPGMLGDAKAFVRRFRTPIEKQGDAGARLKLSRMLAPFLLRRTKAEVASDLPPKTEIAEQVDLTPAQADLYEATRLIMHERVRESLAAKGLARSSIVVLDALLKLRQVCCDPRLLKTARTKGKAGDASGSAKLQRLLELIEQLQAEGRRALIFSQFTSMLELIRAELDPKGLTYSWLTGDTEDRREPVRRFQSGETSLFLISLKAGGSGLNLTAADTVILYDPWWNPAVEAQAIDRAHRIGQSQPVFVHRLIATGTIEEKMLSLQARKRELANALWDQDAKSLGGLTEEDIRDLFAAAR